MPTTWISEKFPRFEKAIHRLTEQHRELEDEPLYLALCYGPARDPQDIFLLEVVGNGAEETIRPERELFETTFTPTPAFPMEIDQRLHLILTNPEELEVALRERWTSAAEILNAVKAGDYRVLYANRIGSQLVKRMESRGKRKKGVAGG